LEKYNKMLPVLLCFYHECMLPEILASRYNRHMPIRNPKYIVEAKEKAAKKSNIQAKNIREKARKRRCHKRKKI